eukprot:3478434-Amphidinium_carterae.1
MSVLKLHCRLVEPQVQTSHHIDCKWYFHAYDMESEIIRHDCARKQQRVAVDGKKYTRCQHKTVLLLASFIPCQPGAGKLSIHGQ